MRDPFQKSASTVTRTLFGTLMMVATLSLVSTQAVAQDADAAVEDSTPQTGLHVGALSLHPGVQLEGGYDNNVFYENDDEKPRTALLLAARPSIGIKSKRSSKVKFDLEASARYLEYVSDDPRVSEQSGLTLQGDASATFNPQGTVAVKVYDNIQRTNEPSNGLSFESYNRLSNRVGGSLIIQPGGKVLTGEFGGSFSRFTHDYLVDLDRSEIALDASIKWKFLPKTAVLLNVDWRSISYDTKTRSVAFADQNDLEGDSSFLSPFNEALENVNSTPLTVETGIKGLVGNRVSVTLLGGFSKGFYESGEDFAGFTGMAELSYEIGPTSRAAVGYERGFSDSTFGNFRTHHKGYANYNQQLFGKLDLQADFSYIYQQFAVTESPVLDQVLVNGQPGANAFSTNERVDPLIIGQLQGDWALTDIVTVGARYQVDVNTSDFVTITGVVADEQDPDDINSSGTTTAGYTKHRIFLTTGVQW